MCAQLAPWSGSSWRPLVLAFVLVGAVGCGPSTAVRARDDAARRGTVRPLPTDVELPMDVTWLAVAASGDTFYCIGQPVDAAAVASADRSLLAVAGDGSIKWRAEFALPSTAVPSYYTDLVGSDQVLLYLSDYVVMGLSPADGSVLWTLDNQMSQMRLIGVEGDLIYTWSYPTTVFGHSVKDGSLVDTWEFQGYSSLYEAWLTTDGKRVVGYVDINGEQGVAVLELSAAKPPPREVFREPQPYTYQTVMLGPARFSSMGLPSYDRSDFAAKVVTTYEAVEISVWSVDQDEPIWQHQIPVNPDDYYSYYAPRLLLGRSTALVQEPMSEGIILRNVLRLHLHGLAARERRWTNVVPTRQYANNLMELPEQRVLVHTISDQGDFTDRWYVFSATTGELVWTSEDDASAGQTRSMAASGGRLARLMTTNWMDSRLLIDVLNAPRGGVAR